MWRDGKHCVRATILAYSQLASLNQKGHKDLHPRSGTVTAGKSLTRVFSQAGSVVRRARSASIQTHAQLDDYGIAYACTRVVLTAASFLASDPRPSPFNAVYSVQRGGCAGCVVISAKVAHAQLFRACSRVLYYGKLNGGGLGSKASSFPPGNWFCI